MRYVKLVNKRYRPGGRFLSVSLHWSVRFWLNNITNNETFMQLERGLVDLLD